MVPSKTRFNKHITAPLIVSPATTAMPIWILHRPWRGGKGLSLQRATQKMCQILCSTVAHCRHKKLVRTWDINRLQPSATATDITTTTPSPSSWLANRHTNNNWVEEGLDYSGSGRHNIDTKSDCKLIWESLGCSPSPYLKQKRETFNPSCTICDCPTLILFLLLNDET